ncbi:MAG: flagellar basal body protein [Chitinivibrionales bacterium]|nr:flagellar basal body protein [Chitinivibrionales bacterium]
MELSLSSALSGLQTTQTRQDATAYNVANVNSQGFSRVAAQIAEMPSGGARIAGLNRIPNADPTTSNTDLAQTTGEQIENKTAYGANLAVMKVQNNMLGALLDLNA